MANFRTNIARSDLARAWIFENGFQNCNNNPEYVPCMSFDSLTQDAGDRTRIECPDPYKYGSFIEVGTIPGEISRLTTTLTSRMTRDSLSSFRRYFNQQCSLDIELVFGLCERPNIYGAFDKIIVFEDVFVTSFGTDPLSALASADRAEINETIDISVGNMYEIVKVDYAQQGIVSAATLGPLIDGVIVDVQSCGVDCNDASSGCDKLFTIDADGGLLWTINGGDDWNTTVTTFVSTGGTGVITGIDTLRNWVWAYNTEGEIAFSSDYGIRTGQTNKVITGLSTAGADQDAGWEYGLVVGSAGFIGYITNPGLGFQRVIDPITANDLAVVRIGVYDENRDFALAGGAAGTILYSEDGENWATSPTAPTANAIVAVYPKTPLNWLVATATEVFCTDDGGQNWSANTLPCPVTAVHDIQRGAGRAVLWLTATDSSAQELIFRSTDGGNTWVQETQGNSNANVPNVPTSNAIVPCVNNVNGLWIFGDTGAAGAILAGTA